MLTKNKHKKTLTNTIHISSLMNVLLDIYSFTFFRIIFFLNKKAIFGIYSVSCEVQMPENHMAYPLTKGRQFHRLLESLLLSLEQSNKQPFDHKELDCFLRLTCRSVDKNILEASINCYNILSQCPHHIPFLFPHFIFMMLVLRELVPSPAFRPLESALIASQQEARSISHPLNLC